MNKENIEKLSKQNIEIKLLLEAIYLEYGYDFRDYKETHITRRIKGFLAKTGLSSISKMQERVLYDENFFKEILQEFSINVTEMFRDPEFYKALREEVVPILKTYPFIKIWHAGCSQGQEVYSMAILLHEEGLLERTQIYATDINNKRLKEAKEGIYRLDDMNEYDKNYKQAGGKASLSDYYVDKYDLAIIDYDLKKRITFAHHNLVTDGVFSEMHLIICRNVLIYFNNELKNKVIKLFKDSLVDGGILGLGSKEDINFSNYREDFCPLNNKEKIYKKKYLNNYF